LGRHAEALAAFQGAVRAQPLDADANFQLGMAYLFNGDKNGAVQQYNVLKGIDAEKAKALYVSIYH
jgi:Flp pilus assembly protein TadD